MPEPRDGSASFTQEARAAFALVFRSPLALFLLYNLTFVASIFAMYGVNIQDLAFLHSRQAQPWRMITALAPASWVVTLVLAFNGSEKNHPLWPRTKRGRLAIVLWLIPGLSITALPLLAQSIAYLEDPLVQEATANVMSDAALLAKTFLIDLLGLTSAMLLASGLVSVHLQLLDRLPELRRRQEQPGTGDLEEDVRWYQRHQSRLKRFLALLALAAGTSILSLSAARNLFNQSISAATGLLPTTPILGYGIYYTGLIASLYLPAHKTLTDVGHLLVEQLIHQSLGAHATWKQRYEERQTAQAWLGMQGSALQDLQQALSVLAPLLASISSLILGPGG